MTSYRIHMRHPSCPKDTLCGVNVVGKKPLRVSDDITKVNCPTCRAIVGRQIAQGE